jgi:hypothetical protein
MTNPNPIKCCCDGSGTYTAEISIRGALLLHDLPCPLHTPQPPRVRLLVRDGARGGKVGEVMDYRSTSDGERVDLRPPGGGCEWIANPDDLEVVEPDEVPT